MLMNTPTPEFLFERRDLRGQNVRRRPARNPVADFVHSLDPLYLNIAAGVAALLTGGLCAWWAA